MSPIEAQINHLAEIYEQETGFHLEHRGVINPREMAWLEFIRRKYQPEDLVLTIHWIQGEIKATRRHPAALKFSNLLGDIYKFEEDLQMALAAMRNARKVQGAREKTLSLLRPIAAQETPLEKEKARKAQEVALAAIQKLKKDLGFNK